MKVLDFRNDGAVGLALAGSVAAAVLTAGTAVYALGFGAPPAAALVVILLADLCALVLGGIALAEAGRRIREGRAQLTRLGSHDHLTDTLRPHALEGAVERRSSGRDGRFGAFLLVHADHVRAIHARHGLGWGDEALRLIASSIRSSIRADDVVGRLGTTEFGVFLAGAAEGEAREVGERIRERVSASYFAPAGAETALRVEVAGIVSTEAMALDEMFRNALSELQNSDGEVVVAVRSPQGKAAPLAN